jgi:MFS family permease
MRQTAMRLSRVVLPATFAVLYALGAMMPTLPVIRDTGPETRTLLASVWMIARWCSFVLLGVTVWWHTRPRALLIAALGLLVSFLGITLLHSVPTMIIWQIVLGVSMGLIYSGSLYFGMVLSDGSAEHGGYHEALIGLGSILGPGAGFFAQTLHPGDQNASIIAVSIVLWISIMLSAAVSLGTRRKKSVVG